MSNDPPLNPGVPARKRSSFCKFCLCISLVLFGLALATIIFVLGKTVFQFTAQITHSRIYQNQTLDEVKNRTTVVRPLVDKEQTFDIAVSIWSRSVEEHEGEIFPWSVRNETALYSDIVFRGLHLADKHKSLTLSYKLPVANFRRLALRQNDLRASFVLIPTSPSLMDQVFNFSTARRPYDIMQISPVRSWPFPLGTSDNRSQSLADRALDSFAISMPLLEFHEFRSKCATASSREKSASSEEVVIKQSDDDEEDQVEKHVVQVIPSGVSDITKYPEHAVKRHPFVVTRTQIRVVDEVHIFNRKAYNREHEMLRRSYGLRDYRTYGNWETRLELQIPDPNTGELLTEWAYAPYIGVGNDGGSSAGPKDIVPLPVTRENCTEFENMSSIDPEFVNIDWQLSYSGRSPKKFVAADMGLTSDRVPHNESDYKKALAHDAAELHNGLFGHRFYEDAHPRRRLTITLLLSVLYIVWVILDMSYWYTRTSTVSISVLGTVLLATSKILSACNNVASLVEGPESEFQSSNSLELLWLTALALTTGFPMPLFMLKTVTRVAVSRDNSRWFPSIRRISPTHRERASQRLDSRTNWRIKAGVCVLLAAINYLFLWNYNVLAALHPPPSSTDGDSNIISHVFAYAYFPLKLTGDIFQLLLNYRSRTFAGSYKLTVVLACIYAMLVLTHFMPLVVGRYEARPGLSIWEAVEMVLLAAMAWQAAVLPKVTQKMEDEDSE
ncbi:hypothetical protein B0H19DRAFT_1248232 [Mycena capillaripes]|nr:hypothetical protein B0H19DRAFT_1260092 [Mycena capillaripes]KAJ6588600.1 hypothetical protein B0H19DRAFT_1248232 [Mycena capillaripes]